MTRQRKKKKTEEERQDSEGMPAWAVDLDLSRVVWVRGEEDERDDLGWWPGKVKGQVDDPPYTVERFGNVEPKIIEIKDMRSSLRVFNEASTIAMRKMQTNARVNDLEAAIEFARDEKAEEDDNLPSFEHLVQQISSPRKRKRSSTSSQDLSQTKTWSDSSVPDNLEWSDPLTIPAHISKIGGDDRLAVDAHAEDDGELILARWKGDKRYYPAKIHSYHAAKQKYRVMYSDGSFGTLRRSQFFTASDSGFLNCKIGSTIDDKPNGIQQDDELQAKIDQFKPHLDRLLTESPPSCSWRAGEFFRSAKAKTNLLQHVSQGPLDDDQYAFLRHRLKAIYCPEYMEPLVHSDTVATSRRLQRKNSDASIGSTSDHVHDEQDPQQEPPRSFASLSIPKKLDYIADVLVPEFVIQYIMEQDGVEYDEADRRMMEDYDQMGNRWAAQVLALRNAMLEGMSSLGE